MAERHRNEEDGESRAAIYARTSSVNQQFGYSLDEQVRQCYERCEMIGWEVTHVFRDQAESGKDTNRPAFQRMEEGARADHFDVVVFWKLDRFSRSIIHAVEIEEKFRQNGVGLHSVTEQLDTTNAAGRFNFRNIANAAEFERDLIKQRTKMGMRALALDHRWPNASPPLGYDKDSDDRLVVVESEASLVIEIFEMYVEEASMPQVAENLNDRDIETKRGKSWTPRAVRDVLTNEVYLGEYSVAGVEDHVPEYEIIDQGLFDRARSTRTRFQRTNTDRDPMPSTRKSGNIREVKDQYADYLERK